MIEMKRNLCRRAAIGLALALCLGSAAASADMLSPPAGGSSLAQIGLVFQSNSVVYVLNAPSAGTFDVKLSDLLFPDPLASLNFSATTATGVLGQMSGPGELIFDVGSAGSYYAHVTAVAQGIFDIGVYGLRVNFTGASPVPLSNSAWFLLAGLGAIGLLNRRRFAVLRTPSPSLLAFG